MENSKFLELIKPLKCLSSLLLSVAEETMGKPIESESEYWNALFANPDLMKKMIELTTQKLNDKELNETIMCELHENKDTIEVIEGIIYQLSGRKVSILDYDKLEY